MALTRFEKFLPWTGAVAAAGWIGHASLWNVGDDEPGKASSSTINEHLLLNIAGIGCLVLMGIALAFFASAVRRLLRTGESAEATYSSVAYGGWLLTAAGVSQMTVWGNGVLSAAYEGDDAALRGLDYVAFFGWAGMTIGIATAFIAMGIGGIRCAMLPRWFSLLTTVLGVLCAAGAARIPPGGLVTYVLLPFWLVAASIIISMRQKKEASGFRADAASAPQARLP